VTPQWWTTVTTYFAGRILLSGFALAMCLAVWFDDCPSPGTSPLRITVTVTDAELRGMAFDRYADELLSLITETQPVDVQIQRGQSLGVVVEDDPGCLADVEGILEIATLLTRPDLIDAFAG
jgi:hypothetical protein